MLTELVVHDLGVIAELGLVLGPGMTAVTGETGAGKTLIVEAVELLVGARADAALVRAGASEARVEGRFVLDPGVIDDDLAELVGPCDGEVVVARVVPGDRAARSRAYLNGRLVPVGALAALGRRLVDLHGQHAHQSLLSPAAQRAALDAYAGERARQALEALRDARRRLRELDDALDALGGDERARAREVDLLGFQVGEIDAAAIAGPGELEELEREEAVLADASAHREAAASAYAALEGPVMDGLGAALKALGDRDHFAGVRERAAALEAEAADLARQVRLAGEAVLEDPDRLEAVVARRRLLHELCRKYGETLADVVAYRQEAADRLGALVEAEARAGMLEADREAAATALRDAAARLSAARRDAAARLGPEVTAVLAELAMPEARLSIEVAALPEDAGPREDGGDEVTFLLAANPGEPALPLARVASGGELARTMLAVRVVLSGAPPTLVFDEVDAGIGGEAGVAVGRKLALVARRHQVLCVTHLAQIAAFADSQVVVGKAVAGGRTVARARHVDGPDRIAELSRMLAGRGSGAARDHAEELLRAARDVAARPEGAP